MSLWDKTEYDLIEGTFAGEAGGTEITATDSVDLRTVLRIGDIVKTTNDSSGENIIVLGLTEDTITVAELEEDIEGNLYRKDVPSWVRQASYAETLAIVSTDEASNAEFKSVGLKTPGWTRSVTYVDQNGKTRNKVETLVAFKSDNAE